LEIDKAYTKLKLFLIEKNCKIIDENTPTLISVSQGSLWGVSPATAKKNMNYSLDVVESGTRITCHSSLAVDWKNLTIMGSTLAIIIASLCLWISIDLDSLVTIQQHSYWSWIATVKGYIDVQIAQNLANFMQMLSVFLVFIIATEVLVVVYVQSKINAFAEETLNIFQF